MVTERVPIKRPPESQHFGTLGPIPNAASSLHVSGVNSHASPGSACTKKQTRQTSDRTAGTWGRNRTRAPHRAQLPKMSSAWIAGSSAFAHTTIRPGNVSQPCIINPRSRLKTPVNGIVSGLFSRFLVFRPVFAVFTPFLTPFSLMFSRVFRENVREGGDRSPLSFPCSRCIPPLGAFLDRVQIGRDGRQFGPVQIGRFWRQFGPWVFAFRRGIPFGRDPLPCYPIRR